ncbi:MAG TPA: DUF1559 domain-containing protein [Gemmata sp.]
MFVSVNVGKLWDNPDFKHLRAWFEGQKAGPSDDLFGLPAAEIERITVFVPAAKRDAVPVWLVSTKKEYNEAKVLKALSPEADNRRTRIGSAVRINHQMFDTLVFADERTLLFLPETRDNLVVAGLLGQFLAKKSDGPLALPLAAAAKYDVALGIDARLLAGVVGADRDEELAPYLTLFKARTVTFAADFGKSATGTLKLTFPDEASSKRAAPVLKEGISDIVTGLGKRLAARKREGDAAERILFEMLVSALNAAKVEAAGANLVATVDFPYADAVTKLASALPKSYLATVNSTRGQNNLKQLGLAFHNFESAYAIFPSDVMAFVPKTPAMSWRVQILPFIAQDNLWRQLDVTKAWDDPANLKKLEAMEMPKVFEIPGRPAPKGQTYFRVFTLPKGAKGADRPLFVEGQKGARITDITDGTSNTFMIVEAGEAVPWYKPDLLAYDGKLPLPVLGDKAADRFIVLMGDGSVRALRPSKVGERTLRALITTQGGEVVDVP